MPSLWNKFSKRKTTYPKIESDIHTDALIIGGGITGISIAQNLSQQNLQTTVIEARQVGGGTTAHSTGNLYSTTDKNLLRLMAKHGQEKIKTLVQSRAHCIDIIEHNVKFYQIECDFKRVPWYLYTVHESRNELIEDKFKASKKLDLPVEIYDLKTPYQASKTIRMPNQAQMNGRLYVEGLANAISNRNCKIYENTAAHSINKTKAAFEVTTNNHHKITAKYLIHATHIPKGVMFLQSLLAPYREYGVAFEISEEFARQSQMDGIYWGYHKDDNFISSRIYQHENNFFLIAVGQPHKVGQEENNDENIMVLEEFARAHFNVSTPKYVWGGQHYRPVDFLPSIGAINADENLYVATGFSTDGLVYGALSGKIISDLLLKKNEYENICHTLNPQRHQLTHGIGKAIKENTNVAIQYLKDLPHIHFTDMDDLKTHEGKIIEKDGKKLAVYKDENSKLHIRSAICTHMKCVVSWNNLEKSWDCPCHGSRFDCHGKVLEGPALHDLHKSESQ